MRRRIALALAWTLCCGCAPEPEATWTAPTPAASWVLEPRELGLGQGATLERVIVTPPEHVPHPFVPPAQPPGVWILDVEALPTERTSARWIHRTRIRLRTRAVGEFVWPESAVGVAGPGGAIEPLRLPPLALQVASILPELPDRAGPFGLRRPTEPAGVGSLWAGLAGTGVGLVAGVGLARLRRRPASRPRPAPRSAEPPASPWSQAHAALTRAERLGRRDPLAAAHALSPTLRRYLAARYGVDTVGRTAEEMLATEPPFALRSRWPGFTALVSEVDALRFQASERARPGAATGLPEWLARARSLVDDSIPPEHRT